MDPLTGGLLIGGANLLGSIFSTEQNNKAAQQMQQQAEAFDQQMVSQQQGYETQMSNTAYQRASMDMKDAGLNPALMFSSGGPASTPSISAPTIQPAQKTSALSGVGPAIQNAVQSATALKTANATIDNLVADNAKILAQTKLTQAQTDTQASEFTRNVSDAQLKDAIAENTRQELPQVQNKSLTAKNQMNMDDATRRLLDQAGFAGRNVNDVMNPISNLISSAGSLVRSFRPRFGY